VCRYAPNWRNRYTDVTARATAVRQHVLASSLTWPLRRVTVISVRRQRHISTGLPRVTVGLVVVCACVSAAAVVLLVSGRPLEALVVLLSPAVVVLLVFGVFALLAGVAFIWGRIDALRRRGYQSRPKGRTGIAEHKTPVVSRLRSWF
jgi:hypothetical protein